MRCAKHNGSIPRNGGIQRESKKAAAAIKILILLVIMSFILASGEDTPPPATGSIRLTLQSDGTETVDATDPIRWEVSPVYDFSSIVKTGTVATADIGEADIEVDAGGYFVRAYIDRDNDGALSYGDTFSIYGQLGDTPLLYSPNKAAVAAGETISISLSPGVGEHAENCSDIPENFGTIYLSLTYTGTGTVDSNHKLYLGVGQDPTLASVFMGINTPANGAKIYAIVPQGTWYAGGFFDIDGDVNPAIGMLDSDDPGELFSNIAYGSNGTPIAVAAGNQTAMCALDLDGSILFP